MTLLVVPQSPIITKLAFRFRLTDQEYVNILAAAKTDVEVQAWLETFNMITKIDLSDARTKSGLDKLVEKEILTEQRVNVILNSEILSEERF